MLKNTAPLEPLVREMINITCGDCHGGSSGANNRFADFRSSGCASCHMVYGTDGAGTSQDPFVGLGFVDWDPEVVADVMPSLDVDDPADLKSTFLGVVNNPDAIAAPEIPGVKRHVLASSMNTENAFGLANYPITDLACAGCHQGSNRTVLQYWGIRLDQNADLVNNRQYPANPLPSNQFPTGFETAANNPMIFDPAVENATFNGRNANQLIEIEDYDGDGRDDTPPDIHFERGLGCVDCHSSRDTHGPSNTTNPNEAVGMPSRQSQHTKVRCQSCHGGVDAYAETVDCVMRNGAAALCAVDQSGTAIDNVVWDAESQLMRLTSRLTGNVHIVPQTLDTIVNNGKIRPATTLPNGDPHPRANTPFYNQKASYAMGRADGNANTGIGPKQVDAQTLAADPNSELAGNGFSHSDDLDCAACHAAWNNSCVGCHLGLGTDLNENNDFFSNITGEKIALCQEDADFGYSSPIVGMLGVNANGKLNSAGAGMKMFFRYYDNKGTPTAAMTFTDRIGNGSNPNQGGRDPHPALGYDKLSAHTIRGRVENNKEGTAYCVKCHLTEEGMEKYGDLYAQFTQILINRNYEALDEFVPFPEGENANDYAGFADFINNNEIKLFALVAKHTGANPGNALGSPIDVHSNLGLSSATFLTDAEGCPVNPLDNNPNHPGCNGRTPRQRWAAYLDNQIDIAFNLDGIVEWTGVANSSCSDPMLTGQFSPLRDGAIHPDQCGPLGQRLLNKLAHPNLGIILRSWIDADGQLKGDAAGVISEQSATNETEKSLLEDATQGNSAADDLFLNFAP